MVGKLALGGVEFGELSAFGLVLVGDQEEVVRLERGRRSGEGDQQGEGETSHGSDYGLSGLSGGLMPEILGAATGPGGWILGAAMGRVAADCAAFCVPAICSGGNCCCWACSIMLTRALISRRDSGLPHMRTQSTCQLQRSKVQASRW